jgi:hypothetical protein
MFSNHTLLILGFRLNYKTMFSNLANLSDAEELFNKNKNQLSSLRAVQSVP